jgi:predicted outer membrane protein
MTNITRSARFGIAALLMAGAAGAQARPGGSGIPVSKDAPPPAVKTTATSDGSVSTVTVAPAVLPTFSVAAHGPLNEKYMTNIMAGGDSLEIQLGHLAHSKGTAQGVRDYGIMLANDHTAHLAKVKEVITDEGVGTAVPPINVEGDRTRAMLSWLQANPAGKEWDAAYLRFQAQHHQNVYDLLSANLKEAHDDDLEQLVKATLNSLIKHRDSAKSVATTIGVMIQ